MNTRASDIGLRRRSIHAENPGFTLVELMVSIALVGVLVAILLPVLSQTRERAREMLCSTQVRQIVFASTLYAQDNHDWFPRVQQSLANAWIDTDRGTSIRSYFGAEPVTAMAGSAHAGSLAVLMCPSQGAINPSYVHLNYLASTRYTATTYRITLARGNRPAEASAPWTDEEQSFRPAPTDRWYGWRYPYGAPYGSHAATMPRESMIGTFPNLAAQRLSRAASDQPAAGDGFSVGDQMMDYVRVFDHAPSLAGTTETRLPQNHLTGTNTGFADGHVRWTSKDNFTQYQQFYSDERNRLWW